MVPPGDPAPTPIPAVGADESAPIFFALRDEMGLIRIFCKFRAKIGVLGHRCRDVNRLADEP